MLNVSWGRDGRQRWRLCMSRASILYNYNKGNFMKFNEQTLRKTIDDLTLDILQVEQDLIAMKLHKKDLELELISVRLAPPPHAIKNALQRLGMWPKLKPQTRREEHDTKQYTEEDISSSDLCEGSDPPTDYKSANGVFRPAYQT